jgi:hypothetical protein
LESLGDSLRREGAGAAMAALLPAAGASAPLLALECRRLRYLEGPEKSGALREARPAGMRQGASASTARPKADESGNPSGSEGPRTRARGKRGMMRTRGGAARSLTPGPSGQGIRLCPAGRERVSPACGDGRLSWSSGTVDERVPISRPFLHLLSATGRVVQGRGSRLEGEVHELNPFA